MKLVLGPLQGSPPEVFEVKRQKENEKVRRECESALRFDSDRWSANYTPFFCFPGIWMLPFFLGHATLQRNLPQPVDPTGLRSTDWETVILRDFSQKRGQRVFNPSR